jgi:hypothetical protein
MIRERVPNARLEISNTTKAAIEKETACVWGARAIATFELFKARSKATPAVLDLNTFAVAVEYEHEALEHAANGPPGTLELVTSELAALKREALA